MLEEKNDNLSHQDNDTDGNLENVIIESTQPEITILEEVELESIAENTTNDTTTAEEALNTESALETDNQTVLDAITDTNAAESEDETLKERHDIPMQDYEAMSMELLVDELKDLVSNEKVMSVKEHVEEIKKAFLSKYNHFIEEKKEEFNSENLDPNETFQYHSPLKSKFDQYYSLFRDNKNTHFKSLQTNLKSNLEIRLAIVEELKELINPQANIKDTLKHFNELRERWKNAGSIPKDKYNHVWNNR